MARTRCNSCKSGYTVNITMKTPEVKSARLRDVNDCLGSKSCLGENEV